MSANLDVDQTSVSAVVHAFVDGFLPTFAMAAVLMALIWLACAIAVVGAYLGVLAVLAARNLIGACRRCLQRRRTVEYAQLVIAHPHGTTTKVINLDRYRHRRCRRTHRSGHQTGPDSDEDA